MIVPCPHILSSSLSVLRSADPSIQPRAVTSQAAAHNKWISGLDFGFIVKGVSLVHKLKSRLRWLSSFHLNRIHITPVA